MGKNSVRMFGSVAKAIEAGKRAEHGPVAIQVTSVAEALFAAQNGAGVIMVDTGEIEDLRAINQALIEAQLRDSLRLAFGGGLGLEELEPAAQAGADAIDVGRAILDAPILDLADEGDWVASDLGQRIMALTSGAHGNVAHRNAPVVD